MTRASIGVTISGYGDGHRPVGTQHRRSGVSGDPDDWGSSEYFFELLFGLAQPFSYCRTVPLSSLRSVAMMKAGRRCQRRRHGKLPMSDYEVKPPNCVS
jgi:hypothetical protein